MLAETGTFVATEKEGRKRHGANLQSIWASLAFSVLAVANQAYKGAFLILFQASHVRMARKRLDKIFLDKRLCKRPEPPSPRRSASVRRSQRHKSSGVQLAYYSRKAYYPPK